VSDRVRRAYAIEFETKPLRRSVPFDKPWVTATREILGEESPSGYLADGEYREY
jgi:hypothetical protein